LKVGPWTITPPERFRRGAQMMLNKLDPEHIKIESSEVEVDSDHFISQGHSSTFSGVLDAQQYEEWLQKADNARDWGEVPNPGIENVSEHDNGHDILNEGIEEFSFGKDSSVKVH
jgi:hypothetical protein